MCIHLHADGCEILSLVPYTKTIDVLVHIEPFIYHVPETTATFKIKMRSESQDVQDNRKSMGLCKELWKKRKRSSGEAGNDHWHAWAQEQKKESTVNCGFHFLFRSCSRFLFM